MIVVEGNVWGESHPAIASKTPIECVIMIAAEASCHETDRLLGDNDHRLSGNAS